MKGKQPGIVTLAILTALTSIMWVFFSVFRALTDDNIPQVSSETLEPIDPSLDLETLNKVRDGLTFVESDSGTIRSNSLEGTLDGEEEVVDEFILDSPNDNPDNSEASQSAQTENDFGVPEEDLQ